MVALLCLWLGGLAAAAPPAAGEPGSAVPLVIGHRTIHTFRAPLGAFTAADRAENARQRITQAFAEAGAGWTSVRVQEPGVLVELDGKPMFMVLPGDVPPLADTRIDELDPGVRFFATRYFAAFTSPAFTTLTHSPLLRDSCATGAVIATFSRSLFPPKM